MSEPRLLTPDVGVPLSSTSQSWAGMDGATAFHLIERHADGWDDVARMMNAWLQANQQEPNPNRGANV